MPRAEIDAEVYGRFAHFPVLQIVDRLPRLWIVFGGFHYTLAVRTHETPLGGIGIFGFQGIFGHGRLSGSLVEYLIERRRRRTSFGWSSCRRQRRWRWRGRRLRF